MKLLANSSRTEKSIFWSSAALMLLALLLFLNEGWLAKLTGTDDGLEGTALGSLDFHENDVRYKRDRHFDWQRTRGDQKIYIGDSVFAGARSKALVRLNGKNDLHLGENSLVRFGNYNGKTLSDLVAGNFRLQIDGKVQIAINGNLTTLQGTGGSEVQIYFNEKNEPQMKLLRGDVHVAIKKTTRPNTEKASVQSLRQGTVISLIPPQPKSEYYLPPRPTAGSPLVSHAWRIWDLYEEREGVWTRRSEFPSQVDEHYVLLWQDGPSEVYTVEYGTAEGFDTNLTHRSKTLEKKLDLKKVALGENYWRVSRDESEWSERGRFNVVTEYTGEAPRFRRSEIPVWIVNDEAPTVRLDWETHPDLKGYVLEGSRLPSFPAQATQVYWKTGDHWTGNFKTPGLYYFRLRAVDQESRLTEYGKTVLVRAEVPALLPSPLLSSMKSEYLKNESIPLSWSRLEEASRYRVRVKTSSGRRVATLEMARPQIELKNWPVGTFGYSVSAVDRWGREGLSSPIQAFSIREPVLKPTPLRRLASEDKSPEPTSPPERRAETVAKIQRGAEAEFSEYKRSYIQIEGSATAVLSSEQQIEGARVPLLGTAALRGLHWSRELGFEGLFKTKALGYNAEADQAAPQQLEARVHRRWILPWRWFSFLREIQASVVTGAEIYRNQKGGTLYSHGYELAKAGLTVKFPIGRRWETGGEILYGFSSDSSTKSEISGNATYVFLADWSFGLGYRIHFFTAGSARSTPYVLPYRESQGEGFSVLRYSY